MAGRMLFVFLIIACAAVARCQPSNKELTVPSGGCSTFVVDSGSDAYSYNVTLGVASLLSCTNVTITKYFAADSCLNGNGGGNDISIDQINCPKADGSSNQTCLTAFSQVKQDRKVNVSSLTNGAVIDTGNSCDTQSDGFLYIQNGCPSNVTVGIQFAHGSYEGISCVKVAGHSINGLGIAIIVIAAVLVLVCIMAICCCCCCGNRCCK